MQLFLICAIICALTSQKPHSDVTVAREEAQ